MREIQVIHQLKGLLYGNQLTRLTSGSIVFAWHIVTYAIFLSVCIIYIISHVLFYSEIMMIQLIKYIIVHLVIILLFAVMTVKLYYLDMKAVQ